MIVYYHSYHYFRCDLSVMFVASETMWVWLWVEIVGGGGGRGAFVEVKEKKDINWSAF